MACEYFQMLMMGYIDGELNPGEVESLKDHLNQCHDCRIELERYKMLKQITDSMAVVTFEDRLWDGYWAGIYNRLERGIGWFISLIGSLILILGGAIVFWNRFLLDSGVPVWLRAGILISITGLVVLFGSAARERMRAMKLERYKDVRR